MTETNHERATRMLTKIKDDMTSVDEVLTAVKEECTLFQRNMYKNYSQHRRAAFYKHLQEVKRWFRDISISDIKALFSDVKSLLSTLTLESHEHHISWKVLASDVKIQLDSVLQRMMTISEAIAQAIIAMQKAYKGLSAQFSMTYFMPFTLTMNSILARLTVLLKTILVRLIEGHGGLILLYLNEVTKANPLRAHVTAIQLTGYRLADQVILVANI